MAGKGVAATIAMLCGAAVHPSTSVDSRSAWAGPERMSADTDSKASAAARAGKIPECCGSPFSQRRAPAEPPTGTCVAQQRRKYLDKQSTIFNALS